MSTNPTPEAGQVWRDNDERTTYPEFTILAIVEDYRSRGVPYAQVRRGPAKRHIRLDRFADSGLRGYRYIGRAK